MEKIGHFDGGGAYKHHLEKIGDFDGARTSTTSKIGNSMYRFWKKGLSFSPFFSKIFENVSKIHGNEFFSRLLFLAIFQCILEQKGLKIAKMASKMAKRPKKWQKGLKNAIHSILIFFNG